MPYKVELELDDSRRIKNGHCNCVLGINGFCKHTSALVCYINLERTEACTDAVQKWQKPSDRRQSLYPKGATIESLFNLSPLCAPTFVQNSTKLIEFQKLLEEKQVTEGMLYKCLTVPIKDNLTNTIHVVYPDDILQKIFFSNECTFDSKVAVTSNLKIVFKKILCTLPDDHQKFFREKVQLSADNCKTIFLSTTDQSKNQDWFLHRKIRISASWAHKMLHAKKTETRLKYFFNTPPVNSAMRYGEQLEPKAREHYQSITQREVLQSGLIIKPEQNWLCASPDGIIVNNFLCLEIKCPISCAGEKIDVNYLINDKLVKTHPYFTQVQLQMYCMNAKFCNLFVYSETDSREIVVERDDDFL